MKSLILGGSGFLGSHLLEALLARGWDAWALDRRPPLAGQRFDYTQRWVEAEFTAVDDWTALLRGTEVVFHCLGTTLPATSNDDPRYDVQSNLVATLSLLEGAVRAGVRKVVFFSSGGTVYGVPQQLPIPETHPTNPICSYGIVKLAIEKYLQLFKHLHGLDYLVARLSNPYGERQPPSGAQGVVAAFLGRLARGEAVHVWGDGSVVRDFLYVGDAIQGVLAALDRPGPHHVFNVGSGQGTSLKELLTIIEQVTGIHDGVKYLPPRTVDVPINVLDTSRLCETTGWELSTRLEDGIARTWTWVQAHVVGESRLADGKVVNCRARRKRPTITPATV